MGFPGGSDGKESACNMGDPDLIPGLGWEGILPRFDPWRIKWQPIPVFLSSGESHGQRSLVCYSPQGHKESNTCE